MGNGALNCCDVTSSRLNEISINTTAKSYPHAYNIQDQDLDVRVRLLETLTSGKFLQLKVLNAGSLPKGKLFLIKPQGSEDSNRLPKDGCTYFGCRGSSETLDIDISPEEGSFEDNQKGRNFIVYYKIEKDSYWIKDLGKGYGAFVKIEGNTVRSNQVLKNNMLVHIGESFLVINIKTHAPLATLSIKKFSGKVPGETMTFPCENYFNAFLTIGRSPLAQVRIEDNLLSKIQCTIFYSHSAGWTLADGDLQTHKSSTNGTWLYINEDLELHEGMIFKSCQTLFQVTLLST